MQIRGRAELTYTGHRNITGVDDRVLRRAAEAGTLVRVRRGVYVAADVWRALGALEQHRLVTAAALERRSDLVAGSLSAAALWGVPVLGSPPVNVHVCVDARSGTRSEHGFRKQAVRDPEQHVVTVDGLRRTSLARTIVDLALTQPFGSAVVACDWALAHGLDRSQLRSALDELAPSRRRRAAEAVIAFGDARSGSVGESWSRAVIAELGYPVPDLQIPFHDRRGLIGVVDFFWSDLDLVGEFDGLVKYADEGMLHGRTPGTVVFEEKVREDRLRACGCRVARWTWQDLRDRSRLDETLRQAGLRRS